MNVTAAVVFKLLILIFPVTILATIFHLEDKDGVNKCGGKNVSAVCITIAQGSGFLQWRDSSGKAVYFDGADTAGATHTLGPITLSLDSIEMIPDMGVVVYTSTASVRIMKDTIITCTDGHIPLSLDIDIRNPSSPSWAYSACRFSQDTVQLFWNIPSIASECCVQYAVRLSTNDNVIFSNTTSLNTSVSIGNNPINATVYCIDYLGENTTSQEMTIDSSTTPEVTIETLYTSCNGNTSYRISWTTSPPSEGVCTPPITMSTITCTTSSTHQSSYNTRSMICSVPSNETINATVTVTNEARVTTTKSTSADALAQTCQRLNSCTMSEPVRDQLSSAGIAAIFMGLLLLILIVVCIILAPALVCIVRKTGSYNVSVYEDKL